MSRIMKLKETINDVQQEIQLTQEDTLNRESLPKKSLSPTEQITNTISLRDKTLG